MGERIESAALYLDENMDEPELRQLASGEVVVYSSRSPAKETPNEDAAAILPAANGSAVLVVADGMGGQRGGRRASEAAVKSLESCVARTWKESIPVRAAVLNGIEEACQKVISLGMGAGTTVAAVEITDGTVRPYHVGDSIILVIGQRGRIKLMTVMHSPTGFAVEAGVINEEEAMHHEDRHLVLNSVGSSDMRIEVGTSVPLASCDTVILASDGLIDNLTIEEIVEYLRKGPLVKGVRRVAAAARGRMTDSREGEPSKPDDLTLIAYRPKRTRSSTRA